MRKIARRVLGGRSVRRELADIKTTLNAMQNHIDTIDRLIQSLNHDVRHGAGESLPLFLGYSERLRLDAETTVGVAQVLERRLIELEDRLDRLARG